MVMEHFASRRLVLLNCGWIGEKRQEVSTKRQALTHRMVNKRGNEFSDVTAHHRIALNCQLSQQNKNRLSCTEENFRFFRLGLRFCVEAWETCSAVVCAISSVPCIFKCSINIIAICYIAVFLLFVRIIVGFSYLNVNSSCFSGYKDPKAFSWEKYLVETNSQAAPARAFKLVGESLWFF